MKFMLLFLLLPFSLFAQSYTSKKTTEENWNIFLKGLNYFDNEEYEDAKTYLNRAYENGIQDSYINLQRAYTYYYLEDNLTVIQICTEELKTPITSLNRFISNSYYSNADNPRKPFMALNESGMHSRFEFYLLRADAKHRLKDYYGAKKDIQHYLSTNTNDFYANYLYATILFEEGNYMLALQQYLNTLDFKDDLNDEVLGEVYYNCGACCYNTDLYDRALKYFSKAGELGNANAYNMIQIINSQKD